MGLYGLKGGLYESCRWYLLPYLGLGAYGATSTWIQSHFMFWGRLLDEFGSTWGRLWVDFGTILGRHWANPGPTLGRLWSDFGPTLIGPTLDQSLGHIWADFNLSGLRPVRRGADGSFCNVGRLQFTLILSKVLSNVAKQFVLLML